MNFQGRWKKVGTFVVVLAESLDVVAARQIQRSPTP
jgi:hypothetical protein